MKHFFVVLWFFCLIHSGEAQEFRTISGSGNNLLNPDFGKLGSTLIRSTAPNYQDGYGSVDESRPNARVISNTIFDQSTSIADERGLSEWAWVWGQFIDHDISHTLNPTTANGTLGITVPTNDTWFGDLSPNNVINVTRSEYQGGSGPGDPRQQINNITSFLDAGHIYGGRATDGPSGVNRAQWLRANDGTGRLKVTDGGGVGDLLPKWDASAPTMANLQTPNMGTRAYVAGDVRANEHSALLATHTLFVREHNRLADIISSANPGLTDEQIFQRAKKIVGAEIQAITYNEYLPSMGVTLSSYTGYDAQVNPAVRNEFSTAAFRLGHTQINGTMLRLNADGTTLSGGHLALTDSFFTPEKILEGGLEPLFRGLAAQVQEKTDAKLVDGLRNQLFSVFIPGVGLIPNATDLAAMNITRGRDHGLGSYNDVRAAYGLARAVTWADITSDPALQAQLQAVYGDINLVDLYVGMLSEDHLSGSSIGELANAILGDQFGRLRDGDRFYFENDTQGANSDLLYVAAWDGAGDDEALDWLKDLTLSEIIRLNTDAGDLSGNLFFATPVPEPGSFLVGLLGVLALMKRRRN